MRKQRFYNLGTKHILLITLGVVLLVLNFLPWNHVSLPEKGHTWESFNTELVPRIRSVDDLLAVADSTAKAQNIGNDTLKYATIVNRIVKARFYHGYSHYSFSENWIASIAGMGWDHLSAIVIPDDILKYPMAACSQQSIIMMKCFQKKGIDYRKVGFDHHFALEGNIGGKWYFFDPDLEPDFSKVTRTGYETLIADNHLYAIYTSRLDSASLDQGLANHHFGMINKSPAPRATLFHQATKWLSRILWLLPFGMVLYMTRRKKRVSVSQQQKKRSQFENAA
ncbi:MAG: hypothetical protein ACXWV2_12320 [Chitinophagaceae bacterium]